MNELKKLSLRERFRDAVNAFRGRKIGSIHLGIDVKRCSECEYRNDDIREELLVIAGARAAYMCTGGLIDLPIGIDGEHVLACDIRRMINNYLAGDDDINFDLYIETALANNYGTKN